MKIGYCLVLVSALVLSSPAQSDAFEVGEAHQQMIVVVTDGWDDPTGQLTTWHRVEGEWQHDAIASPVTIGKNGMAWGIGMHPQPQGKMKEEGDGRAPAGVFKLGTGFGYQSMPDTAMPFEVMEQGHYCIDVAQSPLYNQIVHTDDVGKQAVEGSTEGMRRDLHKNDHLYRHGIVVEHNPEGVPGAGSCIFLHHWRAPDKATAGCTAMPGEMMVSLLQWLNPERKPLFVLLPKSEYSALQAQWGLPDYTP